MRVKVIENGLIEDAVTLQTTDCPVCGVLFAMPIRLYQQCYDHKQDFWCPNGHCLSWTETKAQRLEQELARAKADVDNARAAAADEERAHALTRRRWAATKGHLTKLRKGQCPCCQRRFVDLECHMRDEHPDFTEAAE